MRFMEKSSIIRDQKKKRGKVKSAAHVKVATSLPVRS